MDKTQIENRIKELEELSLLLTEDFNKNMREIQQELKELRLNRPL